MYKTTATIYATESIVSWDISQEDADNSRKELAEMKATDIETEVLDVPTEPQALCD